jgi:two-component system, NarL family, sensor histidine kinase UhpB
MPNVKNSKPTKNHSPISQPKFSKELTVKGIRKEDLSNIVSHIQEDEKTKIGHELHDSINPLLSVAILYLDAIKPKSKREAYAKEQIHSVINLAISNIRNISSQLVVSQKQHFSLVQQIMGLIETINDCDRFKIHFEHSPESKLSRMDHPKKIGLLRIVQEQMNNIIRHSQAKNVDISIFVENDEVQLTIQDDGIGFDVSKPSKGIGLFNIASRAKQFNGETQIKSAVGQGCLIRITLPL